MFGRLVTMKLKINSAAELARINKSTIVPIMRKQKGFRDASLFVAPGGLEAIAKSSWDTKEDAEAYQRTSYPEVLAALSHLVEGKPIVESFEFVGSTSQKAAAKTA